MNFLVAISVVFSLCLGSLVAVEKGYWTSPSAASTVKDRDQHFICASRCAAQKKYHAVILNNGDCSCEENDKNIADSTHLIRKFHNFLALMPLTNGPYGFASLGTENVVETIHGTAMQFTEDGPPGYLPGKKALKLKSSKVGSQVNFFSYAVPQSLRTKVEASGMIVTMWVKLTTAAPNSVIFDFRPQNSNGPRFHFYNWENKFWTNVYPNNPLAYAEDPEWHHVAWVFRKSPMTYEVRDNGVIKGTKTHAGLVEQLTDTLRFGYWIRPDGVEVFADAAIYCFTMQELGTKTDAEITAAIEETKGACDQY